MKMKKAVPLLAVILMLVVVTTGIMIFMKLADIDTSAQKTEYIRDAGYSPNIDSKNGPDTDNPQLSSTTVPLVFPIRKTADFDGVEGLQTADKPGFKFDSLENGQVDLNDVAVYNGIISEISVSPTVVTYDYNHDGIVDVKKTVLFFNIG